MHALRTAPTPAFGLMLSAVPRSTPLDAAAMAIVSPPRALLHNRPFLIWFGILCAATAAKNIAKHSSKGAFPSRKLNESGECPFPFIFFHDPVDGLRKHSGKTLLCVLLWTLYNRAMVISWVAGLAARAAHG